jgi:nitroreductase
MTDPSSFPYEAAFDRNRGLITEWEQLALRSKRVAIGGMGGVGGVHLLTLARLGIGAFTIADFDKFEFPNFNRQIGATVATVGRDKTATLADMAHAINPELKLRRFDAGVTVETIDDFLRDADLFVDGLDFFVLELRRQVYARCAALGIPAILAVPVGMGSAFIAFQPGGMSFEQYFRLEGHSEKEQYLRFGLGISPHAIARGYLFEPERLDFVRRRAPSTVAACQLCAGVMAVAAVKLLLRRGTVKPAPYNYQFDPYRGKYLVSRLRFGNAGPLQRLKIAVGRRIYAVPLAAPPPDPPVSGRSPIEEILNLARWAPSPDNTQPWAFKILDDRSVSLRIRRESDNIYDYRNGEPTWLAAGMLIESMQIAATFWQRSMHADPGLSAAPDCMTLHFPRAAGVSVDPLLPFLAVRSVDRRAYRTRRLRAAEKSELRACMPDGMSLDWHEGFRGRLRIAHLAGIATRIRLNCPEAFPIHQRMIDWDRALSPTGIPAHAVGLSAATRPLMRWALRRWERARLLNRLGGAKIAALEMDYLPGVRSAAWFVMRHPPKQDGEQMTEAELMTIGRAVQRLWLTATKLGLAMQPSLAIIAFAHYADSGIRFSTESGLSERAETLSRSFRHVLGATPAEVAFIARIGEPYPRTPKHRSSRRTLAELLT